MTKSKYPAIKEASGVRYLNGIRSVGPIQLNVYAFESDGVLIDTGPKSLLRNFDQLFSTMDVDQVVLTHHHEDHSGGAAYIQKKYHLPIYMNNMMVDYCAKKVNYPFYRKFFWGERDPFNAKPIGKSFSSRTAKWKVIETPGHAVDHLSFLNKNTGQLFAGDIYVHPETKLILRDESIPEIIQSIERLLTYDFDEMFCCHAGYVKDGKKSLKKKHQYLTELSEHVLFLAEKGYSNKAIHKQIFPKKYPIIYFSFGEWHSKHVIHSILEGAHEKDKVTNV